MINSALVAATALTLLTLLLPLVSCGSGIREDSSSRAASAAPLQLPDTATAAAAIAPDPGKWDGERFTENASAALQVLANAVREPGKTVDWSRCAAADVVVFRLGDSAAPPHWESSGLRVYRAFGHDGERGRGHAALASGLAVLRAGARASFKIVGLERPDDNAGWRATLRYEAENTGVQGGVQERGHYLSEWDAGDGAPRLTSLQLRDYERVEWDGAPWFGDRTVGAAGATGAFAEQLSLGMHYWLQRISRVQGMLYFKRCGIAVADADGDGREDVYLCQPGGLPNRLLLQQADGTVMDASATSGVDVLDHTSGALWCDLDNDGDQDLTLATFEGVVVFENTGGAARFAQRAHIRLPDNDLHAVSAIDINADRLPDLYVTADFAAVPQEAFRYHDANDGGRNVLLMNDGAWEFRDATADAGLDAANTRHSLAAAWEDVDNDGDADLYVANDYGRNCLYLNDGSGRFREVAKVAGVEDYGSGMSVSWGDYDRDGRMDLYVGNMFSSAGNRIVGQDGFLPGAASRGLYRRFVKGNTLFHNRGGNRFEDVSVDAGVHLGRWSWCSLFADIDNDGWEDLLAANGYITTEDTGDL